MSTADAKVAGTLALVGGGEWQEGTRDLDAALLEASGGKEVLVLPTAAAYEHPDRVVETASKYFAKLGAKVRPLNVLHRTEAEDADISETVRDARFVYFADGSPLHLRSVIKDSALFEALLAAYRSGAVLAASGAGATVLCDPMVDPRGGAYTVGLGVVQGLAVFPYHGSAADHLRERSIDLLPKTATLVGIDEQTALLRPPNAPWSVAGKNTVTIYSQDGQTQQLNSGATVPNLPSP